jgi:hypothetical protein
MVVRFRLAGKVLFFLFSFFVGIRFTSSQYWCKSSQFHTHHGTPLSSSFPLPLSYSSKSDPLHIMSEILIV